MTAVPVQIKRLPHAGEQPLPRYETDGAVGMDVAAAIAEPMTIDPGATARVPTGFAIAIPPGYEGQIRPRSGLAARFGLTIPNSPGTIDSDYRGELKIILINHGAESFSIRRGDRVAQLVLAPVVRGTWLEVGELDDTARGAGGFGSTGGVVALGN